MGKLRSVEELASSRERLRSAQDPGQPVVRVCLGPGCLAQGADKVAKAFKTAIKGKKIPGRVKPLIKATGCHGFCSQGPWSILPPLIYSMFRSNRRTCPTSWRPP